ncbi:uncharacterized protein SCHCODRAFT_01316115 [Schizophyllum commune H4-8]|uniref:uncharacterized protein n=1 Tax=Schizophyllum commune (strain H4-8 / FGSC 9210) TaxID=578458 RepID=UPI0021601107|nr:uncharacterized protein SCHCODRAFT_01316115 [Schizophyllum commune H4-8]KAI5890178.1 hypothetical protein SCHCODRAFT_01316115 [Schizophyllum commune H4-8]
MLLLSQLHLTHCVHVYRSISSLTLPGSPSHAFNQIFRRITTSEQKEIRLSRARISISAPDSSLPSTACRSKVYIGGAAALLLVPSSTKSGFMTNAVMHCSSSSKQQP